MLSLSQDSMEQLLSGTLATVMEIEGNRVVDSALISIVPMKVTHIILIHFSLAKASHMVMCNFKVGKGMKIHHILGRRTGIFVNNLDSSLSIWSPSILCIFLPTCKVYLSRIEVDHSAVSSSNVVKLNLWDSSTFYQFLHQRMILRRLYFRSISGS